MSAKQRGTDNMRAYFHEQQAKQAAGQRKAQAQTDELTTLRAINADLLEALIAVVAISDRKHDAWDRAHAAIAKAKGEPC